MRAFLGMSLLAALGLLLQTTILHGLHLGAVPDLLLILCVHLGLYRHTVGGAIAAFVLGYLEDSVSGGATGMNAAGMCLVFSVVYLTSRRLWVDNVLSGVVLVFLASAVKTLGVLALAALFESLDGSWGAIGRTVFLQAVLTAAVAPPILAILRRLHSEQETDAT
jgi:rod shape-determining protein MreD